MNYQLLDGKKISADMKAEIAAEVKEIVAAGHKPPKMVAILVGHDGGSETYVASKMKTGRELGFEDELIRFEDNVTEKELLDTIDRLNRDCLLYTSINTLKMPITPSSTGATATSTKAGIKTLMAPSSSYSISSSSTNFR